MAEWATESILHGIVAASVVGLLLRIHSVRAPRTRVAFWMIALACPVVLTPFFGLACPWRSSEVFRDNWALFSSSHFLPLGWLTAHLGTDLAVLAGLAGSMLYLRDLLPMLLDWLRSNAGRGPFIPIPDALEQALARACAGLAAPMPRLLVRPSQQPVLICRGLRRPTIVASAGLATVLSPNELSAAFAHEVAHIQARDPALGWALMVVRTLYCFNPAVQLMARAVAGELERKADQAAARFVGSPGPVASSLRKLASAKASHERRGRGWHRFRLVALQTRGRALLVEGVAPPATVGHGHLLVCALGLGVILFFTVA